MKSLNGKTLAIVHAALISSKSVQPFIDEIIPEVTVVHHVDDTIQNTNFACEPGVIPKANYFKFAAYAHYLEEAGVDLILLACSTFNRAVEFARPMINTPMLQIDDGRLLNQFAVWAPDAALRRKILVDNPARLYGF